MKLITKIHKPPTIGSSDSGMWGYMGQSGRGYNGLVLRWLGEFSVIPAGRQRWWLKTGVASVFKESRT